MKSIQNLLRSTEKAQQLQNKEMLNIKGGDGVVIEMMVEVTTNIGGNSAILFCDRRRRRVGN